MKAPLAILCLFILPAGLACSLDSSDFSARVKAASERAGLPSPLTISLLKAASEGGSRFRSDLDAVLRENPDLYRLVDKQHPLPDGWEPADLTPLAGGAYTVGRKGLSLTGEAEKSLRVMAEAAGADGVHLVVSSTYRSYTYQKTVYARVVSQLGQAGADRESARPGCSQHQTGHALDFGSIDDSFAKTDQSRWLIQNATRFGWSLSFPQGYEKVTGYRWESWHYRYVGEAGARFINHWFGGIQQYSLQFLSAWKQLTP